MTGSSVAEDAPVKRRWRRRWLLLFSWVLALLIGVPLCLSVLVPAIALRYNSELELSWKMVDGILLVGFSTVTWGGFILLLVLLILILPALHTYRQKQLPVWIVVASTLLGGVLGAMGAVPRWYSMTYSQYELWASEEYVEWSTIWLILSFAGGAIFSGLLGGWIVFLDRRAGRSAGGADNSAAGYEREGVSRRRYGKIIYGVAAATVFLLVWIGVDVFGSHDGLTDLILRHQQGVLEDARILLKEGAGARNGYLYFHHPNHGPALEHIPLLGDVYGNTSAHHPGAVEIRRGEGHGHFVVPELTSATLVALREHVVDDRFGYIKVVNDHVYKFGRSLW